MSDLTFDEVVEKALQLPLVDKARLVERIAADMQRALASDTDVQARLERFEANARSMGEKLHSLGWTEDDAEAHIEAVRQELQQER